METKHTEVQSNETSDAGKTFGTNRAFSSHESTNTNEPIDTISGVTKELFEARSATTPEAKKRESITGVIALVVALLVVALVVFLSR